MAKVTIDGKELEIQGKETIIQVALRNGIEIPHYCYHPKLSIAANCRMCLVEVEKAPKLLPACQTDARDGMVVLTQSKAVKEIQAGVMEFLLINHPVDCPICDQAGECGLQDYYMKHDLNPSRMEDAKVHAKLKGTQIGPNVFLDQERCIKCTRCIRFMEEVAEDPQLLLMNRGDKQLLGPPPGRQLDNPYAVNTVDICPVGALTYADFRFKSRVWFLKEANSICTGCARGCNIEIHHRNGVIERYKPRQNDAVNECWLCDEGRLTYKRINDNRVATGLLGRAPAAQVVHAEEASAKAFEKLKPIAAAKSGLGVLISAQASCEDAFLIASACKDLFGAKVAAISGLPEGQADDFLRAADKNPNRAGVTLVLQALGYTVLAPAAFADKAGGEVKALVALGADLPDPALAAKLARAEFIAAAAVNPSELTAVADVVLPLGSFAETSGTFVNAANRIQTFDEAIRPKGQAMSALDIAQGMMWSLGGDQSFASPVAAFDAMAAVVPAFKGLTYSKIGYAGCALPAA